MGGKNAFSASFHWQLPRAEFHDSARMFNAEV
jgi:hypothetical protein